jgi:hypothetical protein
MKLNSMRARLLALFVCLLASAAAFGQHANIKRGFAVDHVYQTGEVDNVNMFNGNLVVQVPIGPRYTVGGTLAYNFGLTYNSKVWDYETALGATSNAKPIMKVKPSQRSNAGLGWLLSFGRILYTNHPSNSSGDIVYESRDGGEHRIYCTLHQDEFPPHFCSGERVNPGMVQGYTRDGTYLRMKIVSEEAVVNGKLVPGRASIEFPDGTTHIFEDDVANFQMRIVEMHDRFGNKVTFKYPDALTWEISDSHGRSHVVKFENTPGTTPQQPNYKTRVSRIEVAQWNSTVKAAYSFDYEDSQQTRRGCIPSNYDLEDLTSEPKPPLLETIRIPTFNSSEVLTWGFTYYGTDFNCSSGGMRRLKLPTGGTIDYTYQKYELPAAGCTAESALNETGGVHTRIVTDMVRTTGTNKHTWVYTTTLANADTWACPASINNTAPVKPYQEVRNSVTLPTKEVITHYFSVWAKEANSSGGFRREDYGLPFTRRLNAGGRFLSTTTSDTNGLGEKVKTYVSYEQDPKSAFDALPPAARDSNRRMTGMRTVYDDAKFADVAYSDFDGLGHFRSIKTDGDFSGENKRTVVTNYNPGKKLNTGTPPPPDGFWPPTMSHTAEWLLETYDQRTLTEAGSATLISEFCFDANGFLTARRTLKGAASDDNDLLAVFGQTGGNVTSEKFYGGDRTPTSSSGCAPKTNEPPQYELVHDYDFGSLHQSSYAGSGFFTVDNDIDKNTGLVGTSRDTAGLATKFTYDSLSRVKTIEPSPGHGPKFAYTYGYDRSPKVDVRATGGNGAEIDRKFVRFDSLGRPWLELKRMPGANTWSVRLLEYDGQNRQSRVSQPEELVVADPTGSTPTPTYWRSFTYDFMGRPLVITPPDGAQHNTSYAYKGITETSETLFRGGAGGAERGTSTKRVYDRHGRLVLVEENSQATTATHLKGLIAKTEYDYDSADRLTGVTMTGDAPSPQKRTFEYDTRGFLTKETHPEMGDTTYAGYDARGHARTRTFGGKTLTFDYDPAERLGQVSDAGGVLKKFVFATANSSANLRKGKLEQSIRRNDLPSAGQIDVTETYEYAEAAGQVSKRTTLVERVVGSSRFPIQQFQYGIDYDDFLQPNKVTMPTCSQGNCSATTTAPGLGSVDMRRTNGLLTSVDDFASLSYHPSGMVKSVTHDTSLDGVDKYDARHGLARPSKVTFTPCAGMKPYFLPGPVLVKANVTGNSCGLQVSWPPAVVCGSGNEIKYRVLRNGTPVSACLTSPKFLDSSALQNVPYSYSVIAEGPSVEGVTGGCQRGLTVQMDAVAPVTLKSCAADTLLSANPVIASVGIPAKFTANLSSANGFLQDEVLIFKVNGQPIGTARTGTTGFAQLMHALDFDPKVYPGAIEVEYKGGVVPAKTVTADLTMVCNPPAYSVRPFTLNVLPEGSPAGKPFQVAVATSGKCSWQPFPDPGLLQVSPLTLQKGFGTFGITVPQNTTSADRNSKVRVGFATGFQDVSVQQGGTGCTYRFEPEIAYFPAETGTTGGFVNVSAPPTCEWSVFSDSNFLDITDPLQQHQPKVGSGIVRFNVTDNQTETKRLAHLILKKGGEEVATTAINQKALGPAVAPVLEVDLEGGSVQNGQNVALRVYATGTELEYQWYVDDRPRPVCKNCAALTFEPGNSDYPPFNQSTTYQVDVFNRKGRVASTRVSWHNNSSQPYPCRVPIIQDSLMRTNSWPSDQFSPNGGATVTITAYGIDHDLGTDVTYQWYQGLPGDTRSKVADGTRDTVRVNPFHTTFYWLEATDGCGPQFSRSAGVFITGPPPGRRRACCSFDINGDNLSDIPWHNTATGQNELWLMSNGTHTNTVPLQQNSNAGARIQSVGDLNADGDVDLVWRDPATGQNEVWLMNRTQRSRVAQLESRPGGQWSIGAVSDYDADGNDDVVWHNSVTGANELWFHTVTEHAGTWALPSSGKSGLYGTGDFNADDKPDLFFHDRTTGQNAIWLMDDDGTRGTVALKASGSNALGSNVNAVRSLHVSTMSTPSMTDPDFVPAMVADMNGDHRPDIVWRNTVTGENKVWVMSGTTVSQTVALEPRSGAGWEIGGGGSSNAGDAPGGGPVGGTATSLSVVAEPAPIGKATAVTATLIAGSAPVAQRLLVFHRSGAEFARLLTDAGGSATAVVDAAGLAAGTYVDAISVRFDGDSTYGASSDSTNLVVTALPAVVTWNNPNAIVYGTPLSTAQFNATANVAGTFVYTPAAGAILDAGFRTLSATFTAADATIAPITTTAVLFVSKAPSSVSWVTPSPIAYGTPLGAGQLKATSALPGTFTYDPEPGTQLPAGTHTLGVTFEPDSPNFEISTATTTITVEKGRQRVVWDDPAPITVLAALGNAQLNAQVLTSGSAPAGQVTYTPPLGTLLPAGVHELRIKVAATPSYDAASASVDIIVNNVQPVVQWNTLAPIVYGTPLSAAQLNATSDVPGAFVYDPPAGTFLNAGTEQLSLVFTPSDPRYEQVSMSATIDILKAQQSITWSAPAPIVYGTPLSAAQLNAQVHVSGPSPAATLTYTPIEGTVLQAGAQVLGVTAPSTENYESATASVTIDVLKATPVITWAAPAPIVYRTPLGPDQLRATATVPGTFVYTPPAGTILTAGAGRTLSVHFTPSDGSNYNPADASRTIDVLKATPVITWIASAPIVYRTPLGPDQLRATADVSGGFTYSPPAGTVLQAGAGQTLSVQFTPSDANNYNPADATQAIDVLKASPVLTWVAPAPIVYRTPLGPDQLRATADVPGTFAYTPAAGTVLQAGAGQTLSVHFTPSDTHNFNDADASRTIDVLKATPILTWEAPAPIVYGTPLGADQLRATADVPGAFEYAPPAGTILDAGTGRTLSVHFTPSDTHNFNDADASRTIDVAKAGQTLSWTPPAPVVYGAPLSAAQLNAKVQVVGPSPAGAFTYTPPAGTLLDAGAGQTLSVAVAGTPNYEAGTLSVTLDVNRAPLSLRADPKSKLYGAPLPQLTGVLTGVMYNDPIATSYATSATQHSITGGYPITAALVDPNNRLPNYDVTITPATLTVLPAPLLIAAEPASKQYSDPLPLLTATFTGFVLGETPAVLGGTLAIQTTAVVRSAPGPYSISIGGLTSTNYAISYAGSTLTVTPEDARVVITSPLLLSAAKSGATSVTLTATVQDISATADAAGDTYPGDIRKATLTFVDRATNTLLCTAPIGLVGTDERTGIAACTFARNFGTVLPASLTVGARIGGFYVRDAAAGDVTLTASARSTGDRVHGSGTFELPIVMAGSLVPDPGTEPSFNFQFDYDKNDAISAKFKISFDRTENGSKRKYELSSASASSLSVRLTSMGGTAVIVGTGTLVDTKEKKTIAAGVPLIITVTDNDSGNGNNSTPDQLGITLLKPEGGVWFSAAWNGVQTVEHPTHNGQIKVESKK